MITLYILTVCRIGNAERSLNHHMHQTARMPANPEAKRKKKNIKEVLQLKRKQHEREICGFYQHVIVSCLLLYCLLYTWHTLFRAKRAMHRNMELFSFWYFSSVSVWTLAFQQSLLNTDRKRSKNTNKYRTKSFVIFVTWPESAQWKGVSPKGICCWRKQNNTILIRRRNRNNKCNIMHIVIRSFVPATFLLMES